MSNIAIRVQKLSKRYRIGQREPYYTFRDLLARGLNVSLRRLGASLRSSVSGLRSLVSGLGGLGGDSLTPKPNDLIPDTQNHLDSEPNHIWALKDVSFEIEKGEVVGIIGRNEAGKSTLLKILSRITSPTEGQAEIYGRVGSLLEVGTGFHPELTGRENVYLNGAILGMRKTEINRKFDEIVAFAEVEKFIDTPVKHFSTGMYLRLAFSVSAHLEPEILLVDEVLAVGDAAFQKKCLGRMGDMAKQGRTVLFVSHTMAAVSALCGKAIMLDDGQMKAEGPTGMVINKYIREVACAAAATPIMHRFDRKGDGQIRFSELHWENSDGEKTSILRSGEDYKLVLAYECAEGQNKNNVLVSFAIKDYLGSFLILHQTNFNKRNFFGIPPRGCFVCRIRKFPLTSGEYSMNIFVGINDEPCDLIEDVVKVTVESGDFFGSGHPGRPALCKVLVECGWDLQCR